MNWFNLFVYGGMFLLGVSFWYLFVYYIMDWLGLW